MKNIWGNEINPNPSSDLTQEEETMLRLLHYPDPEGISADEIRWRKFCRSLLHVLSGPNGRDKIIRISFDELMKRYGELRKKKLGEN